MLYKFTATVHTNEFALTREKETVVLLRQQLLNVNKYTKLLLSDFFQKKSFSYHEKYIKLGKYYKIQNLS